MPAAVSSIYWFKWLPWQLQMMPRTASRWKECESPQSWGWECQWQSDPGGSLNKTDNSKVPPHIWGDFKFIWDLQFNALQNLTFVWKLYILCKSTSRCAWCYMWECTIFNMKKVSDYHSILLHLYISNQHFQAQLAPWVLVKPLTVYEGITNVRSMSCC